MLITKQNLNHGFYLACFLSRLDLAVSFSSGLDELFPFFLSFSLFTNFFLPAGDSVLLAFAVICVNYKNLLYFTQHKLYKKLSAIKCDTETQWLIVLLLAYKVFDLSLN